MQSSQQRRKQQQQVEAEPVLAPLDNRQLISSAELSEATPKGYHYDTGVRPELRSPGARPAPSVAVTRSRPTARAIGTTLSKHALRPPWAEAGPRGRSPPKRKAGGGSSGWPPQMVTSTVPRIVQGGKGVIDSVVEEAGPGTDAQRMIRSPLNAYPPPSTGWPESVKSKLALITGGTSVGGVRKDHIASVKKSIKEKAARDGATEVITVNPAPKQGTHSVEVTPSKTIPDSANPYGSHRADHATAKAGPSEQNSEGGLYREMEDAYPQPSSADDAANGRKSSRPGDEEPYPGDYQTGELSLKGANERQHIVYVSIPVEDLRSAFGDEAALCRDFSNSSAIRCFLG